MDLASLSFPLAMLTAGAFGVLSFLSPCVLPIVPPYLAYMSGVSMQDMKAGNQRRQILQTSIFFVLGLSTVFLLLALAVNRIATSFLAYQDVFNIISGLVIIIFGLHFLGLFRIPFLEREFRISAQARSGTAIGAYILGLAFAFGWSPCLGPALSAILSMIANQSDTSKGLALMAAYAAGLGIPFIISALLVNLFFKKQSQSRSWMPIIQKVMGGLLLLIGLLMISGNFAELSFMLLELFPALENFG